MAAASAKGSVHLGSTDTGSGDPGGSTYDFARNDGKETESGATSNVEGVGPKSNPVTLTVGTVAPSHSCNTPASSVAGIVAPAVEQVGSQWVCVRTQKVVTLGGFDAANLNKFDTPQAAVQYADKAIALHAQLVRLQLPWSWIEPTAPTTSANGTVSHTWNTTILASADAMVQELQAHNVEVLIDFHQYQWSPYFVPTSDGGGQGVPAWYYANNRFPVGNADSLNAAEAAFWTTERSQSLSDYEAFATMMVARYSHYSNVIGYEIFNEPAVGSLGNTQSAVQDILSWQAAVRVATRKVDPTRTIFVMEDGGFEGVGSADLSVFGPLDHLGLDFHDYFNGDPGSGITANGDGWTYQGDTKPAWGSGWAETHTQVTHVNVGPGSEAAQQAVLEVSIKTAEKYGVLPYIGEWGAQYTDPNLEAYQKQMLALFAQDNLSWDRWDMDQGEIYRLFDRGWVPTAAALQLAAALSSKDAD